jgi:REP element-mobilizing transposase RayT
MKKKLRRRDQQLNLLGKKGIRQFGGKLLKGNAKRARPLSTKEAIHLVLKSQQAVGSRSMLRPKNARVIERTIRKNARTFGISIYHYVNVGNHLHLVIRLTHLRLYQPFIRATTGTIARHVAQRQRGRGLRGSGAGVGAGAGATRAKQNFWVARPFTRLVAWGRDYSRIKRYMIKNQNQARAGWVAWGFEVIDPQAIEFLKTG